MENYLIEDYRRKQNQRKTLKNEVEHNKRKRAIKLFEDGLHDVGIIAEALETTEKTVREYLGETRLGRIDDVTGEVTENPVGAEKTSKSKSKKTDDSRMEDKDSKKENSKPKKYTEKDAQKYSDERDQTIIMFSREGLSLSEVASKLNLTLNQAKERYVALGLPIYTKQELEEIRAEESRKKAKKSRRERNIKRKREREQRKGNREGKEAESHQTEEKNEARSFNDVKNMMYKAIKDRKSQKAMNLGRYYLTHADFLSENERKKLSEMVNIIELMRKKEKGKRKDRDR